MSWKSTFEITIEEDFADTGVLLNNMNSHLLNEDIFHR